MSLNTKRPGSTFLSKLAIFSAILFTSCTSENGSIQVDLVVVGHGEATCEISSEITNNSGRRLSDLTFEIDNMPVHPIDSSRVSTNGVASGQKVRIVSKLKAIECPDLNSESIAKIQITRCGLESTLESDCAKQTKFTAAPEKAIATRRKYSQLCLIEVAKAMEDAYSTNNTYPEQIPTVDCVNDLSSYYSFSNKGSNSSYEIIATPTSSQPDSECGVISINQFGNKSPTSPASCWANE